MAIEQDGRDVPIARHEAHLRKAPFTIVISFPSVGGRAMVNASRKGALAEAVMAGRSASSVLPIPAQGLQENLFNPNQRIFVTDTGYNHWYYGSEKLHRFDSVTPSNGRYACRRRIACFSADMSSPSTPVEQFDGGALYLTFVKETLAPGGGNRVEQYAEYLKLIFD